MRQLGLKSGKEQEGRLMALYLASGQVAPLLDPDDTSKSKILISR
jgi:hypothetical protein